MEILDFSLTCHNLVKLLPFVTFFRLLSFSSSLPPLISTLFLFLIFVCSLSLGDEAIASPSLIRPCATIFCRRGEHKTGGGRGFVPHGSSSSILKTLHLFKVAFYLSTFNFHTAILNEGSKRKMLTVARRRTLYQEPQ